jgi:uncharacterized protein YgiM (DUF1202 family)
LRQTSDQDQDVIVMRVSARLLRMVAIALLLAINIPVAALASTSIVPGQSATVSDTGGDAINLRAKPNTASAVLATVTEGETVDVIEGPLQDGSGIWWYKVIAGGSRAYIAADYLSVTADDAGSAIGTVTGAATIFNTGGDPINCRSGAGSDYSVIATLSEGDQVDLTGEPLGAWQPVNCGGQGGYVHTDYIETAPSANSSTTATIVNTGGDPINCRSAARTSSTVLTVVYEGDTVTLTGKMHGSWQPVVCGGNTNGDGANCRSRGSLSGTILAVLSEGSSVQVRGDGDGSWVPVVCAGQNGFVSAQFVDIQDGSGDGGTSGLQAGQNAVVANTGGQGVRLRSKASSTSAIIVVLPEGQGVVVRNGSTGDWVAVTYRTTNGFVHKDYLAASDGPGETPTPTPTESPTTGKLANGDHAQVTDLVNFRESPNLTGTVISSVEEGTVVLVTGSSTNGFYPVQVAGFAGYIHGDFLKRTSKDLTTGGGDDNGIGGETPGNGKATLQGKKMIDYAMKYLGYPYVWATHGPTTFDCSGFTYWVTLKTLKQDIGAGTWSQSISGTPVAFSDLRPGDLVFFQNTYTWGLSHVGIYIGNGQFIHDQNEETGVVVSSLTSTYYATRWWGARRITTD